MANGLTPDIVGSFLKGRQARQQNQLFEQQLAQQAQVQELTSQILSGDQQDAKLKELFTINPKAAKQVLDSVGLIDQRQRDQAANFAFDLINTTPDQRANKIQARAQSLQSQGRDASDTLSLLGQPAEQQDAALRTIHQAALSVKDQAKLTALKGSSQSVPAGLAEFQALAANLSPEEVEKAKRIKLGLDPRARGSAVQTITNLGIADAIADTEAKLSGAKEEGKLRVKLDLEPQLRSKLKLAEKRAQERGDVFNELDRMEAGLPSILDSVTQLKSLAPMATSTLGGRAFNTVTKELGFGSTKGADARTKFLSIVRNQVLPLLKPTFGAQFTVAEGEKLEATMGDINLSPSQKVEALNAFIEQKVKDIQTRQRQLGEEVAPREELLTPETPTTAIDTGLKDLSDDDLLGGF